jgi:hypothetical protein
MKLASGGKNLGSYKPHATASALETIGLAFRISATRGFAILKLIDRVLMQRSDYGS